MPRWLDAETGAENLLTFPLSVPYMRATSGRVYLDFCAFCSGGEIREEITAFGLRGRMLQWRTQRSPRCSGTIPCRNPGLRHCWAC